MLYRGDGEMEVYSLEDLVYLLEPDLSRVGHFSKDSALGYSLCRVIRIGSRDTYDVQIIESNHADYKAGDVYFGASASRLQRVKEPDE